jgi:hypothetical protein
MRGDTVKPKFFQRAQAKEVAAHWRAPEMTVFVEFIQATFLAEAKRPHRGYDPPREPRRKGDRTAGGLS